jgi:hypothetical protein
VDALTAVVVIPATQKEGVNRLGMAAR